MPVTRSVWTIVVAAGSGARFGGAKQLELLGDRTVRQWAEDAARAAGDGVVVVVPEPAPGVGLGAGEVVGGATRSASVRNGLAALPGEVDIVLVHDAARPFASPGLFAAVVAAVDAGADAAVPGIAVADTIKQVTADGVVVTTPDRSHLVAVQTPQAFRADVLRKAHARGDDGTDDASLVERMGGYVVVVPGEALNRKITVPDDLEWARARVAAGAVAAPMAGVR